MTEFNHVNQSKRAGDRFLFIGDSLTDAGRRYYYGTQLGQGYVAMLAGYLIHKAQRPLEIINKGVGGNTMADLKARWQTDAIAKAADDYTIFIGVNDIWHRLAQNLPITTAIIDQFQDAYTYLVESLLDNGLTPDKITLMGLYLPSQSDQMDLWQEYLSVYNDRIFRVHQAYGLAWVDLERVFQEAYEKFSASDFTISDGIHLTPSGHALVAQAWIQTFEDRNKSQPSS